MSQQARRAIALYRKLIRSSYKWTGPQEIAEGEARYELAWHYRIPYPRLHHSPKQFKYKEPPVIDFSRRPRPQHSD
ncbi:hypothetical protein GPECTOR_9g633 [Gonium pectorale]|uniref:Uncharacterized protein n=1 Tax=Gonium pectorale TaxID=33097 RepID=A0A150GSC0_GONPE|nr:hypothetical protein GPECTOR_9g633 [Gonium pectorale]|eukprot:KXZ52588.1 hypothetical protein GPECTOR_9g633 [Gonium pectorale]